MDCGFFERFYPVTSSIGFVKAPLDEVVAEFVRWYAEIDRPTTVTDLQGGFAGAVAGMEPLTTGHRPRTAWLECAGGSWSAVVNCGWQGPDIGGQTDVMSSRMGVRGVKVTHSPSIKIGRERRVWPATMFSITDPDSESKWKRKRTRSISASRDGRWEWSLYGEEQPFEEPERYSAPRVPDRFDRGMLERYCAALGIRPYEEDFYTGPVKVVEYPAVVPATSRFFTFVERHEVFYPDSPPA